MKNKVLISIFGLFLTITSQAQSKGFVIRTNNLPTTGYRYGYAKQLEDGTILALKQRIEFDIDDPQQRLLNSELVIIDTLGNVIKQVDLLTDSLQNNRSQMFKLNNNYVVSGLFFSQRYNYEKIFYFDKDLNKLSENMTVITPHQILPPHSQDCYYNSFHTELANGDLILISQFLCADGKIIFKRFSKEGNLLKSKIIEPSSPDLIAYVSIIHTDYNKECIYLHNGFGSVFKYDSNFSLLKKISNTIGHSFIAESTDILPLKDKFLYYGRIEDPLPKDTNFYVIALGNLSLNFDLIPDDTAQLFNYVPYDDVETTSLWSPSFFKLRDSTFLGFCHTGNFLTSPNMVIVQRFDANLKHQSEVHYVFDNATIVIYSATMTPDQQLLIGGDYLTMPPRRDHFYPSEGFIMKFGAKDEAPLAEKKGTVPTVGLISIISNPVHDYLTMEQSDQTRSYSVNILDMSGKVLRSNVAFSDTRIQIPVGTLPPGVYVYQIMEGFRPVGAGKFVKQ